MHWKNGKKAVISKVEQGDIDGAKECFNNLLEYALKDLFFTECFSFNSDDPSNAEFFRENAMSFGMLLDIWIENFGEGDCSVENVNDVISTIERYDELTEQEKEEAIDKLVKTINAFEKIWNEYTSLDIFMEEEYGIWVGDYIYTKIYGYGYGNKIYGNSYDHEYFFVPPAIDYEFKYFINQDGEIFNLGDPITKDLILTPIYENPYESEENIMQINITTEDESDEEFEIDVYREADKIMYNLTNDKSNYTFREEDWTIDENGVIKSFIVEPDEIANSYKKISYTIHIIPEEDDHWSEERDEILELGIAIGIPEKINGITVKEISSNAFIELKNKCEEENIDFDDISMFLYLPKTLKNFGNNDWQVEFLRNINEMFNSGIEDSKKEGEEWFCTKCLTTFKEYTQICSNCEEESIVSIDDINFEISIDGDENITMPPTLYANIGYITVDPENQNFRSIHGSLYNKDLTKGYFFSWFSQAQSIVLGNIFDYEPIWRESAGIFTGTDGMEIPSTVSEIGFYPFNTGNDSVVYFYGTSFKFNEANFPSKIKLELILKNGEVINSIEEEIDNRSLGISDYGDLRLGYLYEYGFIVDKLDSPFVKAFSDLFYNKEYSWIDDESGLYKRSVCDGNELGIICLTNSVKGRINASGTVSKNNPFEMFINESYGKYEYSSNEWNAGDKCPDPFVRSIRFRNLPDRYVEPSEEELIFTIDDKEEGVTINLKLKKGNIIVKTIDTEENEISATYNIVDENGEIVGIINTYEDGRVETSDKLVYGKYKLVPIEIQEGYNMPEEQEFEIKEDGQLIELEVEVSKKEEPTPEEPTPEDPTPEDPTPSDPIPEDPTPEEPTPEESTPEEPVPEDPTPEESTPEEPKADEATEKLPYTGIVGTISIISLAGGLGYLIFIGSKIYRIM